MKSFQKKFLSSGFCFDKFPAFNTSPYFRRTKKIKRKKFRNIFLLNMMIMCDIYSVQTSLFHLYRKRIRVFSIRESSTEVSVHPLPISRDFFNFNFLDLISLIFYLYSCMNFLIRKFLRKFSGIKLKDNFRCFQKTRYCKPYAVIPTGVS
jgi:hypothetical protein